MTIFLRESKYQNGSSLMMAMIFGFVVLMCVSSLTYVARYDLLSTKSLVESESSEQIEEQYISQVNSKNTIALGKHKIGGYEIDNSLKQSQPLFSHKNVVAALYGGTPTAISDDIIHELSYKGDHKLTKGIILKHLPKHSMLDYNEAYIPINVPYIDTQRMTNEQQGYHLNKSKEISIQKEGFIGYFEKEKTWLLLVVNDEAKVVNFENLDLDDDYKLKIGWSLVKGDWSMYVAVYDERHLYIYKTKLVDLLQNSAQVMIDLSSSINIIAPPSQIQDLTWYYTKDDGLPSLAIASARHDDEGNLSVTLTDLSFNQEKNAYISDLKDSINGIGKVAASQVHIEALDPEFTLSKSPLYIVVGNKLVAYNVANNQYKAQKFTMLLEQGTSHQPIVVKKNAYSYYVITNDDDRSFQYLYTKDSDMINKPEPTIYLDEKIQKIVVKYGLKFIVTKKHLYIVDFDNNELNKIDL
ncbi:MAG: hypothetical protein ACI9BN_001017 [Francisella sp.]|jgi:hypothetical protein